MTSMIKHRRKAKATLFQKTRMDEGNILTSKTRFDIVEAYKIARTNIIYSIIEKGAKTIAISSALPSEGKTTTCINLAITFAETGAKVLLIDGDLRSPRVHRYLKLSQRPGLSNILGGFALFREAVQKTSYENLDALVCGHIPPNSAELLASKKMDALLNTLKSEYDYIFLDSPPINIVTDVAILSKMISGVVIVIRHAQTTFEDVYDALEKFKLVHTKVLGFILNDARGEEKHPYYKTGR